MTDPAPSSSDELEAGETPTDEAPPADAEAGPEAAAEPSRGRGSLLLYAVAFVTMLAAGVCIGIATLDKLEDLGPLRLSWIFSGLAIVAAVAAVAVPRRSR